jgi:hypothetical protein
MNSGNEHPTDWPAAVNSARPEMPSWWRHGRIHLVGLPAVKVTDGWDNAVWRLGDALATTDRVR